MDNVTAKRSSVPAASASLNGTNLTEKKRLILSFSAYLNNLTKPLKMRRNMK
jgi:hypothetical protein